MKHLIFFFLVTLLLSCNDGYYEQYYSSYKKFDHANMRSRSWFPYQLMSPDTYDINNLSSLENNYAFGSFKYLNDKYYDSVFTNFPIKHIGFSVFNEKLTLNKAGKPTWFLDTGSIDSTAFETIEYERFFITRSKKQKHIYFILSY